MPDSRPIRFRSSLSAVKHLPHRAAQFRQRVAGRDRLAIRRQRPPIDRDVHFVQSQLGRPQSRGDAGLPSDDRRPPPGICRRQRHGGPIVSLSQILANRQTHDLPAIVGQVLAPVNLGELFLRGQLFHPPFGSARSAWSLKPGF